MATTPLKDIPNRDRVADDADGVMSRPWLKWVTDLRTAVNRLIAGTFDGDATVAGNLTVTGAFSAASAAITGAITAASAVVSGALSAGSAVVSGALSAASASITGVVSAGSAAITGAITASSATISGALTATSALISTSIVAASAVFIGAVTAASATISGLLTLTGGQIQFPATQVASADANTLDDYEENVFTPTSPNIAYTTAGANYQKNGSWVHVTGFVVFPATADANQAAIDNLPFTVENSSQARGGCVCHFSNSGLPVGMVALNNTTTIQFFNSNTGAALTNAALTVTTQFFNFTYRATA